MSESSDIIANFFVPEIMRNVEFVIGSSLISGFLILFNLRRVQKIEFFEELDKWEGIALIIIFGIATTLFGTVAMNLSIVTSISLLNADVFQLRSNTILVLFLAQQFIPIRLFSKRLIRPLKDNDEMILVMVLEWFAFVVWTQIFFIMPAVGLIIAVFYRTLILYRRHHKKTK